MNNRNDDITSRKHTLIAMMPMLLVLAAPLWGQETAAPEDEQVVELSPFTVDASKDTGYYATSTLAGSRLNSSLFETPASISVFTAEFLQDIGATTVEQSLAYALNAEPRVDDVTGNAMAANDLTFNIRGFQASAARNYFEWGQESESFNVDRLDFSRGPNSILFGMGSPGGIINTTTKQAMFDNDKTTLSLQGGNWSHYRGTLDVNRDFGDNLALRLNLLKTGKDDWREFKGEDRDGAALAATFKPFKDTHIRFDGEWGQVDRVIAYPYVVRDKVSTWVNAGKPISETLGTVVAGTSRNSARQYVYDPFTGTMQPWFGTVLSTPPEGSGNTNPALVDFDILPLSATVSGDANQYEAEYWNTTVFVEQRIGDLWLEAAWNHQDTSRVWLAGVDFASNTIYADANRVMPDGQPNPNVGKYFVEGWSQLNTFDQVTDNLRGTAAYELDLTEANKWLGRYRIAGMVARKQTENELRDMTENNITPAGTSTYPANVAAANNSIRRRVYLDLDGTGDGRRGSVDPRDYPINNINGVTSDFVLSRFPTSNIDTIDTFMVAGQARLIDDRLILTAGWRKDDQEIKSAEVTQDPVTRLFSVAGFENPGYTFYDGETRTYGGVFVVTDRIALFYNNSNNWAPQNTLTITGDQLGPKTGEGEDFGVKLRLFEERLHLTLTRYTTSEVNRITFAGGFLIGGINEIYEAIGEDTRVAGPTSRDSIDTEGEGYELEFTANPSKQWRLTFNVSKTEGTTSNNQRRNIQYFLDRRDEWSQYADLELIAPFTNAPQVGADGGPPRVSDAIAWLDAETDKYAAQNGVTRRQLREWQGSLFTAYTFEDGFLDMLTVGAGVRYRGAPVVGYAADNPRESILGNDELYFNAMLARPFTIFGLKTRVQANFNNIGVDGDPIATSGDGATNIQFLMPQKFYWTLQMTVGF